jgi:hypothetical protein
MGMGPGYYPVGGRLGFFGSISAGWDLARTSWRVLAEEPDLLLVPVVMLLAGVAVCLGYRQSGDVLWPSPGATRLDLAVHVLPLLVAGAVITVLGQAVIVAATLDRLDRAGGSHRVARAWGRVLGSFPTLVLLALLMAAERFLTLVVLRGGGRLLDWIGDLVDDAWDFVTFLAVPVVLAEDAGPLRAVGRSAQLVRQRWGAQVVAQHVIGWFVFLCALPVAALLCFVLSSSLAACVVAVFLVVLVAAVVSTTLSGVLAAVMYRLAVTGVATAGFGADELASVLARR